MKIDAWFYDRGGCLLRIHFGTRIGYADLHPWPQFGDAALDDQIRFLSMGRSTRLIDKSLWLAEIDAEGRRQHRNLLTGIFLPTSHKLLTDVGDFAAAYDLGFRHFKIKLGANLREETAALANLKDVRLRLDFNGRLHLAEFSSWWADLSSEVRERIEVVEDAYSDAGAGPCPSLCYSDWIFNPEWHGRVFKPARDFSEEEYQEHRFRRVMFTHSLDHPLGQAGAVWEAARFYKKYPHLRQPGGFSPVDGLRLKPEPGTGFGFDEQLSSASWQRVR
jgi:o-succinylbenzoate synthase